MENQETGSFSKPQNKSQVNNWAPVQDQRPHWGDGVFKGLKTWSLMSLGSNLFGEGNAPVSGSTGSSFCFSHPCASLSDDDASHIEDRRLHSVPWPRCQSSLQNPHRRPKMCFSNSLGAPLLSPTDSQDLPLPICHLLPTVS